MGRYSRQPIIYFLYVDRVATDAGRPTVADMAATRKTEKYSTLSSAYRFEPIAVENLGVFQGRPRDFFQGVIGGGMGQWSGGTMASAKHEPITGVWGQSPQRGPGAEPLVREANPP